MIHMTHDVSCFYHLHISPPMMVVCVCVCPEDSQTVAK